MALISESLNSGGNLVKLDGNTTVCEYPLRMLLETPAMFTNQPKPATIVTLLAPKRR